MFDELLPPIRDTPCVMKRSWPPAPQEVSAEAGWDNKLKELARSAAIAGPDERTRVEEIEALERTYRGLFKDVSSREYRFGQVLGPPVPLPAAPPGCRWSSC
jgi:hypothetical protein